MPSSSIGLSTARERLKGNRPLARVAVDLVKPGTMKRRLITEIAKAKENRDGKGFPI